MTEKRSCRGDVIYYRMGTIILLIMGLAGKGKTANVLYVAPSPAISHYQMLEPLMLSLARRGHNVTVLSHFPQKEKIANYTDVDLRGMFPPFTLEFTPWNLLDDASSLFSYGRESCEMFASSDLIQKFLQNNNKFDLIFIEGFDTDCLFGVVARLKAPFIVFSAMSLPVWNSDWIYNPVESAYYPDILCRLAGKMSFWERIQNIGCQLMYRGLYWLQQGLDVETTNKHFNLTVNSFDSIKRNVSLIFANSFHGVTGVRPLFPNVVEVGGIHLKPPKPLPETHTAEVYLPVSGFIQRHRIIVSSSDLRFPPKD